MIIKITHLNADEIKIRGIRSWPIWGCGVSEFDWEYKQAESCYILYGEVDVQYEFNTIHISSGDFVVFPKGLKCRWKVLSPVQKHYNFN